MLLSKSTPGSLDGTGFLSGRGFLHSGGTRYLLNYDFTKGFPAALTHTRASGATVVDESGNVVWADENLFAETDIKAWSSATVTLADEVAIAPPSGIADAYRMTADNAGGSANVNAYKGVPTSLTVGQDYVLSCYARAITGATNEFRLSGFALDGRVNLETEIATTESSCTVTVTPIGTVDADGFRWLRVEVLFTHTASNTAYIGGYNVTRDGSDMFLIAGIQMQKGIVAGDFVATAGSVYHAPRITHDSDGNALGYLHEPQGTNLITKHDGSNLILTNLTRTLNQAVSPSGATDATELNLTGTGTFTSGQQNTAGVVGGTDKTLSVWFKKPASDCADYLTFGFVRSATQWAGVQVNLTGTPTISVTGDEGAVVLNGSSLEEGANGWWRLSVTATDSGNTTVYTSVYPSNAAWDGSSEIRQTLTGDSTSKVYIWGHQLEEGTAATSLIPTYGAEATRQADACSLGTSLFAENWNDTEGTLIFEGSVLYAAPDNNKFILTDGSINRWVYANYPGAGDSTEDLYAYDGATFPLLSDGNDHTAPFKLAIALDADNSLRSSFNGEAPTSLSQDGSLLTDPTDLKFFENHGGIISRFRYSGKALPDTRLITLTT